MCDQASWKRKRRETSTSRAELDDSVSVFLEHLLTARVASVPEVAAHFGLTRVEAQRRFLFLLAEGALTGLVDADCFVSLAPSSLDRLSSCVHERGRVEFSELAVGQWAESWRPRN